MIKINNKVVPEGYELVWEKPENTIYKDCMVAVESIALIKRKKVHGFYVRCAFRSLNEKAISALKVGFSLKDEAGNTVCSVEDYQYDGFDTARGSIFGQTFAIPVKTEEENEEKICRAEVSLKEVIFDDGQQIKCGAETLTLPAEENLTDYFGGKELADFYISQVQNKGHLVPVRQNGLWRCTCGAVNREDEAECFECGVSKQLMFDSLDADALKEKLDEINRQKEEEERLRLEEEEREREIRKKKQKKIGIITAAVLVVVILAYVFVTYLLPPMRYNSACDAMDSGDYIKAIELFEKLGDYKESTVLILQSKYSYGLQQREAGEFDSAIEMFEGLGLYKDSRAQATETRYLKGEKMIKDGQYKEAIELFSQILSYKQSESKRLEAMYGFVSASKDSKDSEIYACVNVLRGAKYKDIEKIYDRLYKWEVSIVINNSEENTETPQSKISKSDIVHCHVTLNGGTPDGKTKLKYSATYPDGSTTTGQWSKEWKAGTEGLTSFWYDIPEYGSTGTFTVKVYNAADGKLLGKASVELTN